MVETMKYEIVREIDKVEIRRYPRIVIAKVEDPTNAFNLLYRFITGQNRQQAKVKMTTPVVSQQIQMTSPVLSETGTMAFVMPSEYTLETTPEPLDRRVKIAEIPARLVAALCFSGGWSESHFEKETQELLNELAKEKNQDKRQRIHNALQPPIHPGILTKKRSSSRSRIARAKPLTPKSERALKTVYNRILEIEVIEGFHERRIVEG